MKKHFVAVNLVGDAKKQSQALPSYLDLRGTLVEASMEAPSRFRRSAELDMKARTVPTSDHHLPVSISGVMGTNPACMEAGRIHSSGTIEEVR